MDYNQFEGVIPEGEYGGGTVMIWDKGVWAPDCRGPAGDESEVDRQLKKGDLKFVLLGDKLLGSWVLVRTRGGRQWLLIKHRDEYASAEDLTVTKPRSVVSGRTMAEIGLAAGASPRQLEQAAGADPAEPPAAPRPRRNAGSAPRRGRRPDRAAPRARLTELSAASRGARSRVRRRRPPPAGSKAPGRRPPARRPPGHGRRRSPCRRTPTPWRSAPASAPPGSPISARCSGPSSGSPSATCSSTTPTWRPCCCRISATAPW